MEARFARVISTSALSICICLFSNGHSANAAGYKTTNFVVSAPTPELAKEIGDQAEVYRRQLSDEWLGKELPPGYHMSIAAAVGFIALAGVAAEIGVMKSREEIDALDVMGIDPMEVLVVPRIIGLVIALPLLTFFADIMGLVGGAMISNALLDIAPLQYVDRVRQAVDDSDLFVGLFKAPIFAFFIGIMGCMHGLRVRGSAESVGRETTRAVVKAIFFVIVLDALFSILFEKVGI